MDIVRVNQKNQVNIPKEISDQINFGPDRYVQVIADKNNVIYIIPIVPEPVYSKKALEGLDQLVEHEKTQAIEMRDAGQIKKLFHPS